MTPNDFDAYLKVLKQNHAAAGIVRLGNGVEFSITFEVQMPEAVGQAPTPGGWKSPLHLDNPENLRPDSDFTGELPE